MSSAAAWPLRQAHPTPITSPSLTLFCTQWQWWASLLHGVVELDSGRRSHSLCWCRGKARCRNGSEGSHRPLTCSSSFTGEPWEHMAPHLVLLHQRAARPPSPELRVPFCLYCSLCRWPPHTSRASSDSVAATQVWGFHRAMEVPTAALRRLDQFVAPYSRADTLNKLWCSIGWTFAIYQVSNGAMLGDKAWEHESSSSFLETTAAATLA
jgi:hypothetical protein